MSSIHILESEISCTDSNGTLVTEASVLGLPPGAWPDKISFTMKDKSVLGFHYSSNDFDEGGLAGVYYHARNGRKLLVIND